MPLISLLREIILKHHATAKMTVYDTIGEEQYHYVDSVPIYWQLSDSTKSILGYECQLATTHFRGRCWFAWFTTNIPFGSGPWKFCGLPGLIMEVYDVQRHHRYIVKGIEQKKTTLDHTILLNQKPMLIDREKLQQGKLQYQISGGELSLLGVSSSGGHYPKDKEMK